MSDENFIDSSEHWGVVTDHIDWFSAWSFEKRKWLATQFHRNYLYIFTYSSFKTYSWDIKQPMTKTALSEKVKSELELPKMKTYKKADITGFRVIERWIPILNKKENRMFLVMEFGNQETELFMHGHGHPSVHHARQNTDHFTDVHARLMRGLSRKLRPFPGDIEAQKEYDAAQFLPGEMKEIDI